MAAWTPSITKRGAGEREQLMIVDSLIRENRLDEAEQQAEQILDKHRRSYSATMALARIFVHKKEFLRAAMFYERAAKLNAEDAQAPLRAARAYLRVEGDAEASVKAEAALHRALEIDPRNSQTHATLGQLYAKKSETTKAIEHVRQALRIDPANVSARILHARLRNKVGDHEVAIEELEMAAHLQPDQVKVALHMARLHLKQHEYASGERVLVEAIEDNPKEPMFWDYLGRVRLGIGDVGGAIEALQEAVNLQPGGVSVKLRLINALAREGRSKEARAMLATLRNTSRVKRSALRIMGDIFLSEDRPREACEYFRASLLATPDGEAKVDAIEAATAGTSKGDYAAQARQFIEALDAVQDAARAAAGPRPGQGREPR